MLELNTFLTSNKWLLMVIIMWELIWKGLALWKAARKGDRNWYIAILILNTVGMVPIVYLLVNRAKKK